MTFSLHLFLSIISSIHEIACGGRKCSSRGYAIQACKDSTCAIPERSLRHPTTGTPIWFSSLSPNRDRSMEGEGRAERGCTSGHLRWPLSPSATRARRRHSTQLARVAPSPVQPLRPAARSAASPVPPLRRRRPTSQPSSSSPPSRQWT